MSLERQRKPVGWQYEPARHSLAARGISSSLPYKDIKRPHSEYISTPIDLQNKYVIGRIIETRDAIDTSLLDVRESRSMIREMIYDIEISAPVMSITVEVETGDVAFVYMLIMERLKMFVSTGLIRGNIPTYRELTNYLNIILSGYRTMMKQRKVRK